MTAYVFYADCVYQPLGSADETRAFFEDASQRTGFDGRRAMEFGLGSREDADTMPLWLDIDFETDKASARWTAEQPPYRADTLTVAQAIEIATGYVQMMTAGPWSAPDH